MREEVGDAWDFASRPNSILAITTNGFVKANGRAVMGRGIAKEARDKFPDLDLRLGRLMLAHGNHVFALRYGAPFLVSFPVKHRWVEKADLTLIERSANELVALIRYGEVFEVVSKGSTIYVPRPGCGNGGLNWTDVKPVLEPVFDDRFVVIDRP